ncbi:MAG TPA: hypothetical protein VEW42_03090 [Candidatus Eisenbacteria bacterium]|nr:hypothetical protein [Candidatus Eisenbacteria bacterium]
MGVPAERIRELREAIRAGQTQRITGEAPGAGLTERIRNDAGSLRAGYNDGLNGSSGKHRKPQINQ